MEVWRCCKVTQESLPYSEVCMWDNITLRAAGSRGGRKEWEAEQGENGGREAKAGQGSRREQRRAQREQREKGREEWEWEGRGILIWFPGSSWEVVSLNPGFLYDMS